MRASPSGDRLLYELGMLIGRSRKLVWTAASRALEDNGFSALSWVLLTYLGNHGAATQREIAAAIGQHPAGVSRLLDEIQAEGLVRRRRDAEDRRRARVELTARGRTMFEAGRPHVISALRETLRPLSVAELKQLQRLLQTLLPPVAPPGGRRCAVGAQEAPRPAIRRRPRGRAGADAQPISRKS